MIDDAADIAIVGAGPAGAHLASLAGAAGYRVLLFDPKGAWEKPCGGGVTSHGLKEYSFLIESQAHPYKSIDRLIIISSAGQRVGVDLQHSFAVYSRAVLNDLIVQRAIASGATFIREKIVGFERFEGHWALRDSSGDRWSARILVGADGAASSTRRRLIGTFPAKDTALAMGYNVFVRRQADKSDWADGADRAEHAGATKAARRRAKDQPGESTVVVQFAKSFSGYLWAFPRVDSINFGVASKLTEQTSSSLRGKLDDFVFDHMSAAGLSAERSDFFAAKIPVLDRRSWKDLKATGDRWALIGDAAGFVDPITGEGIYYALKSADLLFACLTDSAGGAQSGLAKAACEVSNPTGSAPTPLPVESADFGRAAAAYESLWRREFGRELERASQLLTRFYDSRFLGRDFNDAMVTIARRHLGVRETMTRAIIGEQSYISLKKDLLRSLFRPF